MKAKSIILLRANRLWRMNMDMETTDMNRSDGRGGDGMGWRESTVLAGNKMRWRLEGFYEHP